MIDSNFPLKQAGGNVKTPKTGKLSGKRKKSVFRSIFDTKNFHQGGILRRGKRKISRENGKIFGIWKQFFSDKKNSVKNSPFFAVLIYPPEKILRFPCLNIPLWFSLD